MSAKEMVCDSVGITMTYVILELLYNSQYFCNKWHWLKEYGSGQLLSGKLLCIPIDYQVLQGVTLVLSIVTKDKHYNWMDNMAIVFQTATSLKLQL